MYFICLNICIVYSSSKWSRSTRQVSLALLQIISIMHDTVRASYPDASTNMGRVPGILPVSIRTTCLYISSIPKVVIILFQFHTSSSPHVISIYTLKWLMESKLSYSSHTSNIALSPPQPPIHSYPRSVTTYMSKPRLTKRMACGVDLCILILSHSHCFRPHAERACWTSIP